MTVERIRRQVIGNSATQAFFDSASRPNLEAEITGNQFAIACLRYYIYHTVEGYMLDSTKNRKLEARLLQAGGKPPYITDSGLLRQTGDLVINRLSWAVPHLIDQISTRINDEEHPVFTADEKTVLEKCEFDPRNKGQNLRSLANESGRKVNPWKKIAREAKSKLLYSSFPQIQLAIDSSQ